jgi:endonuclease YncB( thermonuclease family)
MASSSSGSKPDHVVRRRRRRHGRSRRLVASLFASLVAFCLAVPAFALEAAAPPPAAPPGTGDLGTATVARIVDARTLLLDDGRTLHLAGIELPGADLPVPPMAHRRGDGALDDAALAALGALVAGKPVSLRAAGPAADRHGRLVAHLVVDGTWVEADLVARGLARVRSRADDRAAIAPLLQLEAAARQEKRGLWADRAYAVRDADDAAHYAGSFQIVEGTVVDTAYVDGQVYVHFGADWHDSFSLRLDSEARRLCRAAGFDPRALKGRHVRVRGFIDGVTRPVMAVTHPEQIELL